MLLLYRIALRKSIENVEHVEGGRTVPFNLLIAKRAETLAEMSACKRAGPASRWRNRFWNLRVVARLRGLIVRHSSSQACAKLTTTGRNRLKAKAARAGGGPGCDLRPA
jgi:hypothetical protein